MNASPQTTTADRGHVEPPDHPPAGADAAALRAHPITDRDMGQGDRLLRLGEQRAEQLVDAWGREGAAEAKRGAGRDPLSHARRIIATGCLYGIAPERAAVTETRRRLEAWANHPGAAPICVDHTIRRGHRALGFEPAQLAAFDPRARALPPASDPGFGRWLAPLHLTHVAQRRVVIALAISNAIEARAALERADAVADTGRVIGDVLAASPSQPARDEGRRLLLRWLADRDAGAEAALRRIQSELRQTRATFHWTAEFSELNPDAWAMPGPCGVPR